MSESFYMFKLVENACILKTIIDSMKELSNVANFTFSSEGIYVQLLDSSHISVLTLELSVSMFSEYTFNETLTLGICLESFSKVLKFVSTIDNITLVYNTGSDSIHLYFESVQRKLDFKLQLVEVNDEKVVLVDFEPDCIIKMNGIEFQKLVKDLSLIGDTVMFENDLTSNTLSLKVDGQIGSAKIILKKIDIQNKSLCKVSFTLKYLISFCKATSLSTDVILTLTNNFPMEITYKINNDNTGCLKLLLAPKMNDVDDDLTDECC